MKENLRIAIATELQWTERRHYELVAGIQEYTKSNRPSWHLEVTQCPELRISEGAKYDGIVGRITQQCYEAAKRLKIVNTWIGSPAISKMPSVLCDPKEAARMAVTHLAERGLCRFAHIGTEGYPADRLGYEGAAETARKLGFDCSRHIFEMASEREEKFWAQFRLLYNKWEFPIGVILGDDFITRSLLCFCVNNSWKVPDDVAVVSMENNELACTSFAPTVSSVDMGYHRIGYKAAQMLDELIQGRKPEVSPVILPPKELIVRESSNFYAVRDPKVAEALLFMSNNCDKLILVPDIADAVGLGRRVLEQRFKSQTGRTILSDFIRLRIEKLKRLLVETDTPIKDLPRLSGFGTSVHMHNMFKRHTGMTPVAYRQTHSDNRQL